VGYNGSASCGEGADRASIDLAGVQLDLLQAVLATGTPTIVVLVHGRPVSFGQDHGGVSSAAHPLQRGLAFSSAYGCGGRSWD
jgi:beta-xylosidase